jgi:hypothetical protein
VRHAGPRFIPALVIAVVGGAALFLASATWLEVLGASVLLIGAALIVGAIATPEFLEADADD